MFFVLALAATLVSVRPQGPAASVDVLSGEEVLQRMHDRYSGHWFNTLIFVQRMTAWDSAGKPDSLTSYVSIKVPGTMRTEFAPLADGRGSLRTPDSTFLFQHGAVAARRPANANALLTLAFDIYGQPVASTVSVVRNAGYDLSKVHRETWDGTQVYVVGADSGDLNALQFWVDAKRLVLVRLFTKSPIPDYKGLQDIRLQDWKSVGKGMVAPHVEFYLGGKKMRQENYYDIKANADLSPDIFDETKWMTAANWAKG